MDPISVMERHRKGIIAVLLMLIIIGALYYSFKRFEGPSQYGNDPSYVYIGAAVSNGSFHLNSTNTFSLRITEAFAMGMFYRLFGINSLSSSLWSITAYIGLIIVTFLFVRMFYDNRAALISALVVGVFPLVTKFAVNAGNDLPLAFIGSLAVLFFLYGERLESKAFYFGSGILLVAAWLTSYESGIIIAFVLLYGLIEIIRKKASLDQTGIFFVYGIALAFLIVILFSTLNANAPFITIAENLKQYGNIGTAAKGLFTVAASNQNSMYYIDAMFPYHVIQAIGQVGVLGTMGNLFTAVVSPQQFTEFGFYIYLALPILLILLLLREKRAFFAIFWFSVLFLALEFGPMHLSISTNPIRIIYVPAYRLTRLMLVLAVPLAAIIGIGLAKLLEFKNEYLLLLGAIVVVLVLAALFVSNYNSSNYWYYWQQYPQKIMIQAATFIRTVPVTSNVYLEGTYNNAPINYSAGEMEFYLGNPLGSRVNSSITDITSCSAFATNSYVIWSGGAHCANWQGRFSITTPESIPAFIVQDENQYLFYRPTNIYYVEPSSP